MEASVCVQYDASGRLSRQIRGAREVKGAFHASLKKEASRAPDVQVKADKTPMRTAYSCDLYLKTESDLEGCQNKARSFCLVFVPLSLHLFSPVENKTTGQVVLAKD